MLSSRTPAPRLRRRRCSDPNAGHARTGGILTGIASRQVWLRQLAQQAYLVKVADGMQYVAGYECIRVAAEVEAFPIDAGSKGSRMIRRIRL